MSANELVLNRENFSDEFTEVDKKVSELLNAFKQSNNETDMSRDDIEGRVVRLAKLGLNVTQQCNQDAVRSLAFN